MYPTKLDKIINLFESLPEDERRETLFRMQTMRKSRSRVKARILISSMFGKTRSAPTQSAFICT